MQQVLHTLDPSCFHQADVPWKEVDAHYPAILESMRKDGQKDPIKVDRTGAVFDGWLRLRACRELGITPVYEVVSDGNVALLCSMVRRRDSVIVMALFVTWLWNHRSSIDGLRDARGPRHIILSEFLGKMLAASRGMSPKSIERYLAIGEADATDREYLMSLGDDISLNRASEELQEREYRRALEKGYESEHGPVTLDASRATSDPARILRDVHRLRAQLRTVKDVNGPTCIALAVLSREIAQFLQSRQGTARPRLPSAQKRLAG